MIDGWEAGAALSIRSPDRYLTYGPRSPGGEMTKGRLLWLALSVLGIGRLTWLVR